MANERSANFRRNLCSSPEAAVLYFDAASIYRELHAALTAFAKGVCVLVGGRGSAKLATALLVLVLVLVLVLILVLVQY